MKELFERCLKAEYTTTEAGGDYAVQYEDGTIYLLFEKSDGKGDWRINFDFPAVPYSRMTEKWYYHRGFLKMWKSMRDQIEEAVARIVSEKPVHRIICVGYSHGAAIALLATEDMVFLYKDLVEIKGYGYGAPRGVWGFVPKAVKERMLHFEAVRNIPDIVTHVPPVLFGFRHLRLRRIGKSGKYGPVKAHYAEAYLAELERSES